MPHSIFTSEFRPALGLRNRHVQTLLPRFLPRAPLSRRTEILNLPDGDFVELAWVISDGHEKRERTTALSDDAPLFVLFHGLEGDFNRKKTSAFFDLMGKQIADESVTVVDDGTIDSRRGSLSIDDEGTPTNCTTLIENGILTGYMQDRLNSRLMGVEPTGNGRRESYAHAPMPRMTNTYMMSGNSEPEEIIKTVKNGLYAVDFGGGQVDITSGKFVFTCTEAYKIIDGKVDQPVKGATLIGNGPDVLKRVKMVGNDSKMDAGIGTCGKDGQSVPVGVGQPTMLINNLTVGGTATS